MVGSESQDTKRQGSSMLALAGMARHCARMPALPLAYGMASTGSQPIRSSTIGLGFAFDSLMFRVSKESGDL